MRLHDDSDGWMIWNARNAHVAELADALDSGLSFHPFFAVSSPCFDYLKKTDLIG